jgi:hypothetical protein
MAELLPHARPSSTTTALETLYGVSPAISQKSYDPNLAFVYDVNSARNSFADYGQYVSPTRAREAESVNEFETPDA